MKKVWWEIFRPDPDPGCVFRLSVFRLSDPNSVSFDGRIRICSMIGSGHVFFSYKKFNKKEHGSGSASAGSATLLARPGERVRESGNRCLPSGSSNDGQKREIAIFCSRNSQAQIARDVDYSLAERN